MSKVNPYLLALLITGLLTAGCSNHYYSPALYKNDIAYQFKPMSCDSEKTANYVTGSLIKGFGYSSDFITLGQLAYNRAHTYQNFNLSYGAYGYAGTYKNQTLQNTDAGYFDEKSLSGLGLRFSADYFTKENNCDYRLFGIDASYSKEFGAYSDFRKTAQNMSGSYSDGSNSILTAGITNEITWHNRNDSSLQYGYRFFFGAVFGNHQFVNGTDPTNANMPYLAYKEECIAGTFFIQVKNVQGIIDISNFSTFRFSLGYRF